MRGRRWLVGPTRAEYTTITKPKEDGMPPERANKSVGVRAYKIMSKMAHEEIS